MEYQEELIDLLNDIEDGIIEDKSVLLKQKDFIKNNLLEGTELVQKINSTSKSDPNYEVYKETVDNLSNNLVKIYNIDKKIFEEILIYSGFMPEQAQIFSKAIESSENKVEEMTNLLVESYSQGINILQNPNSKKIMSRIKNQDTNENQFSEFLEYILNDVLPSQAMENIAKFSIFQRAKLEDLIKNDSRFKSVLDSFNNGIEINKFDKKYVSDKITYHMEEMFKTTPIYKFEGDIGFVKIENEKKHINIWNKTAGRNRPDAYGIDKNGTLYIATVTSNTNFENQNNQSIEWANYIDNGMKMGKIPEIKDFKIIICCNPIINELDEKGTLFKSFKKEIQKLEQERIISQEDIICLKRLSIDAEMLSIFRNVSLDKYQDFKEKLEFSVLGEEFIIIPKDMNVQYKECMTNLESSLTVLNTILTNNPSLDKMQTAFKFLVETVAEGMYNGINSPLKRNQDLHELTKNITKLTSTLKKGLLQSGHDVHKSIKSGSEDFFEIADNAEQLNSKYKDEKDLVLNKKISSDSKMQQKKVAEQKKKEYERIKKGTHNCSFDNSASSSSLLSQIMAMTYNKGNISESLMNDAMIFQAKKINNKPHSYSIDMLVTGLTNVYRSKLPYDLTRTFKHIIKYQLEEKLLNAQYFGETSKENFKQQMLDVQKKSNNTKNKLSF